MDPDDYSAHEPDEVFNQPPALANYNLFEHDRPLSEALHREGGGWHGHRYTRARVGTITRRERYDQAVTLE